MIGIAKYRKKPVEVEAFLLGVDHIPSWFFESDKVSVFPACVDESGTSCIIHTLEGNMVAHAYEHYIIKGVAGELYPCEKSIFEATYECLDQGIIST